MQSISPETIYRGRDAWIDALPHITKLTKRPLILGKSFRTNSLRENIIFNLIVVMKISLGLKI